MTGERPAPPDDGPRVLAFVAPWCGPCRRLEPMLTEAAAGREDGVRLVTIRVDHHPETVDAHRVRATPTTIALHGGTEVARVVGGMTEGQIEGLFATARRPTSPPPAHRGGARTDLVLRVAVAVTLLCAGGLLHQPILLITGGAVAVVTALLALPRRRTPTRRAGPAVPSSGR